MANKNADQLKAFYQELAKVAKSEDWQSILKVAKKILGVSVNDKKAFQCKIVCLIQLGKFDEALTSLQRYPTELNVFYFERAYCEYRLNQIEDALKTLKSCPNMTYKEKELMAQVHYRLEQFEESYDLYRDLIKTHQDDFDLNRQTNLTAVVCALNNSKPGASKNLDMSEYEDKTYELCYNSACLSLSRGKFTEAEDKLKKAEEMCKDFYQNEEDFDESELEDELAIIKVQLAYCLQKLNKNEEATKIYNTVLKNKPSDLSAIAVASNNIVTLNNDQNIFDSKKRIKTATSSEMEFKLTSKQRFSIAFNEILLAIIANQNDIANKLLDQFKNKFTQSEEYLILKVSQLHKEKKLAEAEKLLREHVDANKLTCSILIRYYLIQILVFQGKYNDTVNVFKSIDSYYNHPGVVNALVSLYNMQNKPDEASSLLQNATEHFLKTNPNAKEIDVYLKDNAQYQIKLQKWEKAAELLESLRKRQPKETKIISQLISVYSKFKPEKAKEISGELPPFESLLEGVDLNDLEAQFSALGTKYGRSKAKDDSKASKAAPSVDLIKKKKLKKKKTKLPKNYDANVPIDLERWLPLRERSYYKGRRKKKGTGIGKGTQGAVSNEPQSPKPTSPLSSVSSPQAAKAAAAAEKASAPPKAKLAAAQAAKKKKKGGKW